MNKTLYGKPQRPVPAQEEQGQAVDMVPTQMGHEGMEPTEPMEPMAYQPIITEEDIDYAIDQLQKYKSGKQALEQRVIEDEMWYKLQHWNAIHKGDASKPRGPEPTSAWLFNAISNKHADAMDNFPTVSLLAREQGDAGEASTLSSVVPCVLERAEFEQTYSDNWWDKLKHGTAVYFTGFNTELENGLGDIDITAVDLLNIFWQPGINHIQQSRNLFITALEDNDLLDAAYPEFAGTFGDKVVNVSEYVYDDTVDTSEQSVVVDWYYKRKTDTGRTVVHYVKFCGRNILFASENDDNSRERGFYDHGQFPVDFDVLYPEKGTPAGFGMVSIAKSPQLYIDKLGANILEHSLASSKLRYMISDSCGINEEDLNDYTKSVVKVAGSIDETHVKQLTLAEMDSTYVAVLNNKIEELKETSSNRDVSSGGSSSGVTAAAAIAALQEAGNKSSRDMIQTSYRCYTQIAYKVVENIRQFYDEPRMFRIVGQGGMDAYVSYSNLNIQQRTMDVGGMEMMRKAVFDINIKAEKRSPYNRLSQNETAKELYSLGLFNPENAQPALICLSMMEFDGKDSVVQQVSQGQTLLSIVQQQATLIAQMQGAMTGQAVAVEADGGGERQQPQSGGEKTLGSAVKDAQAGTAMTNYGESLVKNATPDVGSGGAL